MDTERRQIRSFFARYLRSEDFDDADDVFTSGRVNSLFAIQLVLFVEKQFSLTVDSQDLDVRNFSSVDAVYNFVLRKGAVSTRQASV
jgi:methoxymalonate biosynthesis acyl carrier protein